MSQSVCLIVISGLNLKIGHKIALNESFKLQYELTQPKIFTFKGKK